jgi:hypothetical protein
MRTSGAVAAELLLLLSGMVGAGEEGWLRLGETPLIDEATSIQEITSDQRSYHDREVRIEGRIASVCTQEGCFIEVAPEAGGGIVVNLPGLVHTFPTDCAGL